MSWTAAVGQLRRLLLVTADECTELRAQLPARVEHLELGARVLDDLGRHAVSPAVVAAVVRAYRARQITAGRALEMARGQLHEADLPELPQPPLDAMLGELLA